MLGSGSVRVKQFVVQQSDDDPELDDVQIVLSPISNTEFATVCQKLERMSGVRECRYRK